MHLSMPSMRASSSPAVLDCPSALVPARIHINSTSIYARNGNGFHEAMDIYARTGDDPDLPALARKHDCNLEDLEFLYPRGVSMWERVKQEFGADVRTEYRVEGDITHGTMDIVGLAEVAGEVLHLTVGDWKTGFEPSDRYDSQGKAYAYLAASKFGFPKSGYILVLMLWPRKGLVMEREYTRKDLAEFRDEVIAAHEKAGQQYNPGQACTYCPRHLECSARDAYLKQMAMLCVTGDVDPAKLGEVRYGLQQLKQRIDSFEKTVRSMVNAGEEVRTPKGRMMFVESDSTIVVPSKAFALLKKRGLKPTEILDAIPMSKKALESLAGVSGRDEKRALYDDLREADGLRDVTKHTFREVKE